MHLEIVDMPVPDLGPDDVLIRVRACGICGSDVHGLDGSTGRRLPPIVMGHEASGVIEMVGAAVSEFAKGDRVTFDSMVYCGRCYFCKRGQSNLCDNRQVVGVSPGDYRRHGAFAEYVAVPARIVYRLPDSFPFEHAAMIEAVSVAVHAVAIAPVKLGDTAVVAGAGMIGLLTMQTLRNAGCPQVIAFDPDPTRLKLATASGATAAVSPQEAASTVADLTGGRGADIGMECVGTTEPLKTLLASVRKGGTIGLVGNVKPTVELPLQAVVTREIRLQGSCGSAGDYPVCIDLMAREAIKVAPLITAVAPLADGPAWFDRLYRKEPNLMKVILQP